MPPPRSRLSLSPVLPPHDPRSSSSSSWSCVMQVANAALHAITKFFGSGSNGTPQHTTRTTNEQTHKTQHHIPSIKVTQTSRPHREPPSPQASSSLKLPPPCRMPGAWWAVPLMVAVGWLLLLLLLMVPPDGKDSPTQGGVVAQGPGSKPRSRSLTGRQRGLSFRLRAVGRRTSEARRPHVLATAHNHLRVPDNEGDDWLALPRVTGFATGNSRWSVVVAITKKFPLDFPSSHRPHHAVPLPPVCSRDLSSSSVRCSSPQKAADADARGTRSWRR